MASTKSGLGQIPWQQLAAAEPEMAKLLRSLLGWIPIAYIASVKRDGSPRLHPFCPIFAGDGMYIAVRPFSNKRHDLRRDGRFAMHALPGKRDDEFYMTGRARLVEDDAERQAVVAGAGHTVHPDDDVFELRAAYVMTAHWEKMGKPDTHAVRQEWRTEPVRATNGRGAKGASSSATGAASGAPTRAGSGSRGTRRGS